MSEESALEGIGLPKRRPQAPSNRESSLDISRLDEEEEFQQEEAPRIFAIDKGDGWEAGLIEEPLMTGDSLSSYFEEDTGYVLMDED